MVHNAQLVITLKSWRTLGELGVLVVS